MAAETSSYGSWPAEVSPLRVMFSMMTGIAIPEPLKSWPTRDFRWGFWLAILTGLTAGHWLATVIDAARSVSICSTVAAVAAAIAGLLIASLAVLATLGQTEMMRRVRALGWGEHLLVSGVQMSILANLVTVLLALAGLLAPDAWLPIVARAVMSLAVFALATVYFSSRRVYLFVLYAGRLEPQAGSGS